MTSFEMHINPILSANVLATLTESLMVGDHSVGLWSSDVVLVFVFSSF